MTFSSILDLPINDLEHVPEHIRIDRLTTEAAARRIKIRGRSQPRVLYELWEEGTCILIDTADNIASEIGSERSLISMYAKRDALYDKKFRIRKNNKGA